MLIDALERSTRSPLRIRVLPSDAEGITFGALWRRAEAIAARGGLDGAVAVNLEASLEAVVLVLATWMSGGVVVSLPSPPRPRPSSDYWESITRMMAVAGCSQMASTPELARSAPPGTARSYEDVLRRPASNPAGPIDGNAFVQFTSGSTGDPKGVVLSAEAILANVSTIVSHLEPETGDGVTSWLPLSHDMGFFGMFLAPIIGLGRLESTADIVWLSRDLFRSAPMRWLTASTTFGSTITAAPPSVLEVFARVLARRARGVDLSSLRAVIVGAEVIDPRALTAFDAAYGPAGLDRRALCPAYGLAEATVAVSIDDVHTPWRATADSATGPAVSTGTALPGMTVGLQDGRLVVDGPSMMTGYLDEMGLQPQVGAVHTSDAGAIIDDAIYVFGRVDDVVIRSGRNIYPMDVERSISLGEHGLVSCVAVRTAPDQFALVCERRSSTSADSVPRQQISDCVLAAVGVAPERIEFVAVGSVPRTPSGKPRRAALAALLAAGDLEATS